MNSFDYLVSVVFGLLALVLALFLVRKFFWTLVGAVRLLLWYAAVFLVMLVALMLVADTVRKDGALAFVELVKHSHLYTALVSYLADALSFARPRLDAVEAATGFFGWLPFK